MEITKLWVVWNSLCMSLTLEFLLFELFIRQKGIGFVWWVWSEVGCFFFAVTFHLME